jgi:hypothetical protein
MQPGNCLYLHNKEAESNEGTDLVLNCDANGCGVDEFVADDPNQQFWWDEGSQHITYYPNGMNKPMRYLAVNKKNQLIGTTQSKSSRFFYQMREDSLQVKRGSQFYELTVKGNVKKWADVVASPIVGYVQRDLNDNKNSKWRIEYCYNEQKPNPENSNEGIPQNLDNLKMFPDGDQDEESTVDTDTTDLKFRTLGLVDGTESLTRDLGEKGKKKKFKQNPDGSFSYTVEYKLQEVAPVLGAVLSFSPGTSEAISFKATAQVDINDGADEVENYATLSWATPSNETLKSNDGLVNLYQKIDNPPNSEKIRMTIKGDKKTAKALKGFSLVVENEPDAFA